MKKKRIQFSLLDHIGSVSTLLSILIAVLIGCLLILVISEDPGEAIKSLLVKPLSNMFYINSIINKATPLIFVGLSAALAFRTGLFNMGVQGQFYIGAFAGTLVANYLTGLPTGIHIVLTYFLAICAGTVYAALAGFLKVQFGVNEVVTTLMLNYIATLITSGMTNSYFRDPDSGGVIRMNYIPDYLKLGSISKSLSAHSGILIALLVLLLAYVFVKHTNLGYCMRTVGQNPIFAQYGGLHIRKIMLLSFLLSGAVAALGGVIEVTGIHYSFFDNFAADMGGDGLIIALLAANSPIGVLLTSLFFAYLEIGGQIMQQNTDVSRELVLIIQVIMIMMISSRILAPYLNRIKLKREVRKDA